MLTISSLLLRKLPFFAKYSPKSLICSILSFEKRINECIFVRLPMMPRNTAISPGHFTQFGELLQYLRRRAGLSQRELSIAVGYSDSQISRLEHNQRIPDRTTLTALFLPALDVLDEPEWATRLLELAAEAHLAEISTTQFRGIPSVPHNLPLQLTSFLGREKEINNVVRLLSSTF